MGYKELENKFLETKELKFKLFSLTYFVKEENNMVVIYNDSYSNIKKSYSSFLDMMNHYVVYNETLLDLQDRIIVL